VTLDEVVLLASLQGTVVGVALILLGRAQTGEAVRDPAPADDDDWVPPRNAVPFGPFLAAGTVLVWLVGPQPWLRLMLPALVPGSPL
jgi:leader peptidase (prepilin peptidase)/N-methyltransferase